MYKLKASPQKVHANLYKEKRVNTHPGLPSACQREKRLLKAGETSLPTSDFSPSVQGSINLMLICCTLASNLRHWFPHTAYILSVQTSISLSVAP